VQPPDDFRSVCGFEKQFDRFTKIFPRILDVVTLTGDVELGTKCNVPVFFAMNDGGELLRRVHGSIVVDDAYADKRYHRNKASLFHRCWQKNFQESADVAEGGDGADAPTDYFEVSVEHDSIVLRPVVFDQSAKQRLENIRAKIESLGHKKVPLTSPPAVTSK
jgi:hypothetical protein